jgi:methylated-DNA-[protein]-cysteine S-methyltransferase
MVAYYESPIGLLEIRADQRKLRGVTLVTEAGEAAPNEITQRAIDQLSEYFDGKRTDFSLFFIPMGTEFQREVWMKLAEIPYGKVVTYGQLAAAIGQPTACWAVAQAVGQNPFLILLPCHRVVAADGLGGFSAGTEAKRKLLAVEGVEFSEKKPIPEKFFFTFP